MLKTMASTENSSWDLERPRLFSQVAKEGSLTRVAALTGSPQPAISRKIIRFEKECGGRLFLRTGRGVSLTELGSQILPRVQSILGEIDEFTLEIAEGSGTPRGEVHLGVLPSLHMALVIPLLRLQLQKFPGIKLSVLEGSGGQIDQWVTNGFVDIGVTYRYGRRSAMDAERLVRVGSYLLGEQGDNLTSGDTVQFSKLDGVPLILPSEPSAVRLFFNQLAKRANITLRVVMEADSLQIQKAAASDGAGYTIMPIHCAAAEIKSGQLQASRIIEPGIDRDIALSTTSARPASRAAREIVRMIRNLVNTDQARRFFHATSED